MEENGNMSLEERIDIRESQIEDFKEKEYITKRSIFVDKIMVLIQPIIFGTCMLAGLSLKEFGGLPITISVGATISGSMGLAFGYLYIRDKKGLKKIREALKSLEEEKEDLEKEYEKERGQAYSKDIGQKKEKKTIIYDVKDVDNLTVSDIKSSDAKEFSEVQKKRLEYLKKLAEENPEEARRIVTEELIELGLINENGEFIPPYNEENTSGNDFTMGPKLVKKRKPNNKQNN